MKKLIMALCILLFLGSVSNAETVRVGLEPFPPLINEDSTGFLLDIFAELEKDSDLKFDIKIMPFVRAIKLLEIKKVDVIAITFQHGMGPDFYKFGADLDWAIQVMDGLFTMDDTIYSMEEIKKIKKIGIPRGNINLFHDVYQIPKENFYEGDIVNLLKMLKKGRISAFLFERTATMIKIKEAKLEGIHYQLFSDQPPIKATMSTRNTEKGKQLKQKMDDLIKKHDFSHILQVYLEAAKLPKFGIVSIEK